MVAEATAMSEALAEADSLADVDSLGEVDSLAGGVIDGACCPTPPGSRIPATAMASPAPAATPAKATMAATTACCGDLAIHDHADLSPLTCCLAR
jgi:hypothetical protein